MDLQDLQNNWDNQFDTKEGKENLVMKLFKESRQNKVQSKLKRMVVYSILFMVFNLLVIIYSWIFIANNFPNLGVLVPGGALLIFSFIAFYMNVFQLNDISKIKFDAPIIDLQKTIEKLKIKRIRFMRFIFIFHNLYFWLMVVLVFSFDMFGFISTVWENAASLVILQVAFAILWFPIAFWLIKKYSQPKQKSKFWSKMSKDSFLTDQSVNLSLNRALGFLNEIEAFEKSN